MNSYWWTGAGLLAIAALTTAIAAWGRVGVGWLPGWALLRATAQLAVVALLLRGVFAAPGVVALFILLMLLTSGWTSGQRLKGLYRGRRTAAAGVLAGAAVALAVVFGLRLVAWQTHYLVAVAGIVIGGAMSAATLAGRIFVRDSGTRAPEIEAWLSLGATPSQAHLDVGRVAVRETLFPNLDQTKSTGLVTLPGAFVGAIFGGASPAEAAVFQLVVLAALGLAITVTAMVVTRLAGQTPYISAISDSQ